MAPRDDSPEAPPYISAAEDKDETDTGSKTDEQVFEYDDSRKLGIVSSVFLILNKMIGTGSKWRL